ncbi:MAG: hypothetical protein WD295_05295 [Bacteroidota bacterium]
MSIVQILRAGLTRVGKTRRLVLFAWLVNVLATAIVAIPMLALLEQSIGNTIMEERLLEKIETNWFNTFQMDHQSSELVSRFDYTIFGHAPFLNHYELYLNGEVVRSVGSFLSDLIFRFSVSTSSLDLLGILALVYVLISSFLAGGFLGVYAREYALSFNEFLVEGARHFGKFFRLSLLSLIVYILLFDLVILRISEGIAVQTAFEPSEMTPFLYYMARNVGVILVVGFVTLCFDFAKVRMVVEDRTSAFFGLVAGVRFVFRHVGSTVGLTVLLSFAGTVLIVLYSLVEGWIPQSGYWTILLVFVLQQAYMIGRFWIRANFYASQTLLFKDREVAEHQVGRAAGAVG